MTLYSLNLSKGQYRRDGMFVKNGPLVTVVRSVMGVDCPTHTHEFEELAVVVSGTCTHHWGGEQHKLARGDVFVITEEESHGFFQVKDLLILNIEYDRNELAACAGDLKGCPGYHALFSFNHQRLPGDGPKTEFHLNNKQLKRALGWVEEIEAELTQTDYGYQTLCRANFLKLVTFLSRSYQSIEKKGNQLHWQLGDVIAFLEQHYATPITVEEMAKKANLSMRQFYRIFQNAIGEPPLAYLLRLRIEKAIELLATTDLPIMDIAFRSGFQDSNYFSRQFKKITGDSPSAYRRLGSTTSSR